MDFRFEASASATQDDPVRDLIGGHPSFNHADRDHSRLQRIDIARDHRLQRHNEMPGREHRVSGLVRHRGVTGYALEGDFHPRAARHHGPGMQHDDTSLQPRPIVVSKYAVHRKTLEESIGEHCSCSPIPLLGGLKDKPHRAGPRLIVGKQRGRPEKTGGMPVMSTRMHDAIRCRCVRKARRFANWKRVHVGAEANTSIGFSARERCNDAMATDRRGVRYSQSFKGAAHEPGRCRFVPRKFRVGVQMPPPSRDGCRKLDVHHGIMPPRRE